MAEQNLHPYSDLVAVSMLANSVSVSYGIPMTMPYVAICAAFDCISSMLTLTFLQKLKVCFITSSNCSNTSFVDSQSTHCYFHHIEEHEVVNAFVDTTIGCSTDGVGDVAVD